MRTKSFVLMISLLVVAVVTLAILWNWNAPQRKPAVGKMLLQDLPVNKVEWIDIRSSEHSVSLRRKDDRWVISDRFDYPAISTKVANLVKKAREVKVGRVLEGSEDILERLHLKDPDDPNATALQKGTRIVFKGGDNKVLAAIILGSERVSDLETPVHEPGQFVRLTESNEVYLVDELIPAWGASPYNWLNELAVKIKPSDIKRITCTAMAEKKTIYTLEREAPGKGFTAPGIQPPQKLSSSKLELLAESLSPLAITDVLRPESRPPATDAFPFQVEFQLYNGIVYRVYPSRAKDPSHVRLEVAFQGKKEEGNPDFETEARAAHERLNPWTFTIHGAKHNEFITKIDELFESSRRKQ